MDDDVASVKFDIYYMVKLRNLRQNADIAIIIIIIMPIIINRSYVETQINVINYSPLDVRFKFIALTISFLTLICGII